MKKVLLSIVALLLAVGTMQAVTASELRVYINPGHGSWGPNDRPMATIPYPMLASTGRPDTCGFYESNTNLWKCLKMGEVLQKMGVQKSNIMYSRVKNGPYPYTSSGTDATKYNRNLSEICREVDANNMDVFISIHSNALTEGTTTNYPLFLYRGTDAEDYAPGSKALGAAMAPYYKKNDIECWSSTGTYNRGDITFMGSSSTTTTSKGTFTGYYGVLRHGTPGQLVEGYFHTYQPARHRALNKDFCGQEGVRAARGFCAYFGLNAETTGYIMGTVKDAIRKITNSVFTYGNNTADSWLPVNGATVKLMKNGVEIASYTVDNNYNGVFVFEGLAPGTYQVVASMNNYETQTSANLTVKANETTFTKMLLTPTDYEPPKPSPRGTFAYDLQGTDDGDNYTFGFKVNQDAENVKIVLKPTSEGGENVEIAVGAVTAKDGKTLTIKKSSYPAGNEYNWEVVVPNAEVTDYQKFWSFSPTGNGTNTTRGFAIDRNPESPYFQQMYVGNSYGTTGKGIYVVQPDGTVVNAGAPYFNSNFLQGNTASPFRMGVNPNNGYLYAADWSDTHSGIHIFNPANTTSLGQFFAGTRDTSTGIFTYNGTKIGGGTTTVKFVGSGANTRLITFLEDLDQANEQILAMYAIGENVNTTVRPVKTFPNVSAKLLNTNVEINADEYGMWVSQTRASGNNTEAIPCFVYADYNDNILFSSHTLSALNGSAGSGVAISDDRSTLAILNQSGCIQFWNITWNGNTPSLSLKATCTEPFSVIPEMQFDHAGNLWGTCQSYGSFALTVKKPAQDVTTPARKSLTITTTGSLVGDVNLDGVINVGDVTALIGYILDSSTGSAYGVTDIDGDGSTNVADVTALINIILSNN